MSEQERTILTWLNKHGYPFELLVARELRRSGWLTEHAVWYRDLDTEKFRELDLVAILAASPSDGTSASASVRLAIECKTSEKPWVLFVGGLPGRLFTFNGMATSDSFSAATMFVALASGVEAPPFLKLPEYYAHGVVKAHGDNKQGDPTAPYAAVRSVLAAAHAVGEKQAEFALGAGEGYPTVGVVVPVVVLDGDLFQYSIEADDVEQLRQVDRAVVAIASPIDGRLTPVHIVTKAGLIDFAREASVGAQAFAAALLSHLPDILMMMRQSRARRASDGPAAV